MGNFAGSLGGHFTSHADVYEISSNVGANTSVVRMDLYMQCDSTATGEWNLTGSASYSGNVNGNGAGGNFNFDFRGNANTIHLLTFDTTVGHDANGNASIGWSAGENADNAPTLTTSGISGSLGLGRLALAPTISALIVDSITPTSARLGAELASYGHGTSVTWEMFYKLDTAGSWTSAGQQGDVGGYNEWTITGLVPGVLYDYYVSAINNNGDYAQAGANTFVTQPVSGMMAVMKAII